MQPGGDPLVLCFVDFVSPAHAATAMDALQGKTSYHLVLEITALCMSCPILVVAFFFHTSQSC